MSEAKALELRHALRSANIDCYVVPNAGASIWTVVVCNVDRDPVAAIYDGQPILETEEEE